MNSILRGLIQEPTNQIMRKRYQFYRQNKATHLAAMLATFFWVIGWGLFKFESPMWQSIQNNYPQFFPHVSPHHPKSGDFLRLTIQSVFLSLCYQPLKKSKKRRLHHQLKLLLNKYYSWVNHLATRLNGSLFIQKKTHQIQQMHPVFQWLLKIMMLTFSVLLITLCVTQPFNALQQFIFFILVWWVAISVSHLPGQGVVIFLVITSLIVSTRYLWWRITSTLVFNDLMSLFFGYLLLFAEIYVWLVLVLGFFQTIWPLHRKPVSLPENIDLWPTVDVFITTYNEDLSVLKPGAYAALGINWPKEKINIYILDDGNRPAFKTFAEEIGVHYIARPHHDHAKAGNINYALQHSRGDLVVVFDCDHIPTHTFLQLTVGWFLKDTKLAILQTPHHFFSPDPFERNLGSFQETPSENALFYGVVQDGNDTWDASYFCGSSGILRRSALEEIGGFAVDSVTEDAHTSLKLQRNGYTSAYIRIPLAAGLATESLSGHIGQRIRWARGMVQILRLDNPLLGKGLSLPQRLCYFNAMLHFLSGIPRLIFYIIPSSFILLNAYIIYAPASMVLLYALPHILHSTIANTRIQGKYRHFLWNEIYETVTAWYISLPTTVALINPRKGKFNVTAKGGLVKARYADWKTARPYLVLLLINLIGLIAGVWRFFFGPPLEVPALLIALSWVLFNLTILGGALGVDIEEKQTRKSPRVEFSMPAIIIREDGHAFPCVLKDYSDGGVGIEFNTPNVLQVDKKASLILKHDQEEFVFPCEVERVFGHKVGLSLDSINCKQHIDFIQCTFARADTWALWQNKYTEEAPVDSLIDVLKLDFKGYLSIIEFIPSFAQKILIFLAGVISWLGSFRPRVIQQNKNTG